MTEAQAQKLLRWLDRTHHLERLSDSALGDLLTATLWASLRLGTPDSDALAEAIARLKGERPSEREDTP
jgi:hypothetical protein